MSTVKIVVQNAPYLDDNKAWHALRFVGAALTEEGLVEGIEKG